MKTNWEYKLFLESTFLKLSVEIQTPSLSLIEFNSSLSLSLPEVVQIPLMCQRLSEAQFEP